MLKRCFKCGEEKPIEEFYKHPQMADGHLNKCIECARADVKKNREGNQDYYDKYEKMRAKLNHRVEARKEYAQTGRGRLVHTETCRRYRKNHPEAYEAHKAVAIAVSSGRLVKPELCEDCGENRRLYAHHEDYSKPLDVNWLCSSCHRKRHIKKAA